MRIKELKGIRHRDVGGEDEICVLFLVFTIENAIAPITTENSGEGLIGLHKDRTLMNNIQQSPGIKVQSIESSEKGFS